MRLRLIVERQRVGDEFEGGVIQQTGGAIQRVALPSPGGPLRLVGQGYKVRTPAVASCAMGVPCGRSKTLQTAPSKDGTRCKFLRIGRTQSHRSVAHES